MSKIKESKQRVREAWQQVNAEREAAEIITYGKVQPHVIPFEEAVLGACLLEKDAVQKVSTILKEGDFYKQANNLIYRAMIDLYERRQPVDLLTVMAELKGTGELDNVGGAVYLAELSNKVASAANIEYHAVVLQQKSYLRHVISSCTKMMAMGYDETVDINDLSEFVEGKLFELTQKVTPGVIQPFKKHLSNRMDEHIANSKLDSSAVLGVPTDFADLDAITGGLQKGDLICIAARPSMGKTAFVKSLIYKQAVKLNKSVAVFSMEETAGMFCDGLIAIDACLNGRTVKQANKWTDNSQQRIFDTVDRIGSAKIFLDDTNNISISYLASKLRELKAKYDIDIAYIDYLQIMDIGEGFNRDVEIGKVTKRLKGLAKELDIPIVFLSQLSRAVLKTADKRPDLSHLRESGNIEQDCDFIMFLHRPWYYGMKENADGDSTEKLGEGIIAKHRHGELATVDFKFINWMPAYYDVDEEICDQPPVQGADGEDLPF
jgi:replicative DNA helicase